jgi:TM2 domain-containing membrane protein YozV
LFDNNLIASTDKSFFPQVHDNITERIKSTTSHKNKITNQPNYNSVKRINKSQNRINKKRNSLKSESNSNESQTGGGSQLVALLLVIFAGVMGIHRFYLGYIGIGIIQLLTGGGCGIWALIDLIRICTGDLKPNGGGYTDTL